MTVKANQRIRETAKSNGVPFWQIADKLGINEFSLSRKMRYELEESETNRIISIIHELAKEKEPA